MKKILALIIGVLLIYLVYYLQKPYVYSSVDPISEINPLILVNSENAFPDNVNLNLVFFKGYQVADTIYNDLVDMYNAALDDNITLKINNAYKYGFILRYPEDKYEITKIDYEPWHYRYVGKKSAKEISNRNLTLEEYLGGSIWIY